MKKFLLFLVLLLALAPLSSPISNVVYGQDDEDEEDNSCTLYMD